MAGAFQRSAYQDNAFQMDDAPARVIYGGDNPWARQRREVDEDDEDLLVILSLTVQAMNS